MYRRKVAKKRPLEYFSDDSDDCEPSCHKDPTIVLKEVVQSGDLGMLKPELKIDGKDDSSVLCGPLRVSKKRPLECFSDGDDCEPLCRKDPTIVLEEVVQSGDSGMLKPDLKIDGEDDSSVLCEPLSKEEKSDHSVDIEYHVLDSVLVDAHVVEDQLAMEDFVAETKSFNGIGFEDTDTLIDDVIFE
jgi:hypothetical protein